MKIGPMSKEQAKDFHKTWRESTSSDKLVYEREAVGKKMASEQGFKVETLNNSPNNCSGSSREPSANAQSTPR